MCSPLLILIRQNDWGAYQPMMDRLRRWPLWPAFLAQLGALRYEELYQSPIHGVGHIERTMLHGAFCAMEEPLDQTDTVLLLECCAYHDVGRINDALDDEHGARSARALARITGRSGEELKLMMAAVEAHSRAEEELIPTLERYAPADWDRAFRLAQLLKDADGLDRVRIWDLDPGFLRREASRQREGFSEYLFQRYQAQIGASTTPPFPPELLARLAKKKAARKRAGGGV